MHINEISCAILDGGESFPVDISTTSTPTAAITAPTGHPLGVPIKLLITSTATCFVRKATTGTPVALNTGVDQVLLANNTYRTEVMPGTRLAFITETGTGKVYITPGA